MKFKRRKRSYKKRQCTPRQRQNRLRKYMKLGMAVLGILCVALVVLRVTGVNPFKRAYSENAGEDIEAVKPGTSYREPLFQTRHCDRPDYGNCGALYG